MPNWKKVIVSGSTASLTKLNVATSVTASSYTGSFVGDGSQLTGIQATVSEVTGSLIVSGSNTTIGTSTVSGSFVTTGSFSVTAKGVGTTWSAGASLTTREDNVAFVGTQTAGLAWGGQKQGYSGAGYRVGGDSEEYDGTNWSTGGSRPYDVYTSRGFGTQTAAVSFGGKSYSTGYETYAVHKYDGTSWTAGTNLPGPTIYGGGAGTQTAGLVAGGRNSSGYVYYLDTTYEFNGTNWSTGGTLPELGSNFVSIAGTQTDAILVGNSSASAAANSSLQSAATYDGTSWTTVVGTGNENGTVVGSKADSALLVNSGLGNSTFIWTGTNWAITANSTTLRTTEASGDGSGGTDSSGLIVGGSNSSGNLSSAEEFDNSLSDIKSLNVTKELNQNVSATGSFHGKFTGDGSTLVLDTNVVFDDEESTFTKSIHFGKSLTHSVLKLTGSAFSTDLQIGAAGDRDTYTAGHNGVRINTGSFGHYLHFEDSRGTGVYQVQAPNFVISRDYEGSTDEFPGIWWPWASSSIYTKDDYARPGATTMDDYYPAIYFDFGAVSAITASADIFIKPSGSLIVDPLYGGELQVNSHILPGTTEIYDLGSSTKRWRDLYLSGSTIDLGGTLISRDQDGDIEFKQGGSRKSLKVDELQIGTGAGARKLKVSSGRLKFTTISSEADTSTDITASAVEAGGSTLGNFTVDGNLTVNGSIIGATAAGTGSTSITTLGTISTGTWQGSAIGDNYISSAATWNSKLDSSGTISTGDFAQFNGDGDLVGRSATETKSDLSLSAGDVGLGNVTNESKSTMFTSPTFTGTPVAPTPTSNDDSTKIATTAYVQQELTDLIGTAPSTLDTLGELSASLANDQDALNSLTVTVGQKLAKSSNLSDLTNASTARTNLGLGSLATLSSVNAATITDNSVGAAELNVSGNGSSTQFLRSDGDGTFSWAVPTDTTTNYYLDGISKSGNELTFSVNGTTNQSYTFGSNAFTSTTIPTNNSQLTNGAGYTTNTGTVGTSGTPVDNDFAKFTDANTIEGRNASEVRSDLGLVIGTNVQAYDADLTSIAGLSKTDGNFIVGNGAAWVAESGATARNSIGLGTSNHAQFHCLGIGTAASTVNGEIRAAGDITAYYSSDERLKENFQTLDGALDKINQINGYEFDWKEGIEDVVSKEGHDIGVKAQELQAVYPELVHERDNGYLAVDYVKLTAVLLQAVKELSAKVDKLENK